MPCGFANTCFTHLVKMAFLASTILELRKNNPCAEWLGRTPEIIPPELEEHGEASWEALWAWYGSKAVLGSMFKYVSCKANKKTQTIVHSKVTLSRPLIAAFAICLHPSYMSSLCHWRLKEFKELGLLVISCWTPNQAYEVFRPVPNNTLNKM